MKKVFVALMAVVMMAGFVGCKNNVSKVDEKLGKVVDEKIAAMQEAKTPIEFNNACMDFSEEYLKAVKEVYAEKWDEGLDPEEEAKLGEVFDAQKKRYEDAMVAAWAKLEPEPVMMPDAAPVAEEAEVADAVPAEEGI